MAQFITHPEVNKLDANSEQACRLDSHPLQLIENGSNSHKKTQMQFCHSGTKLQNQ
jgi:hypothetical protein